MTILDMFSLDGKVAIVTGASSGLGVSFAKGLAEAGADLVLVARRADRLADTQKLVQSLGRRAICVTADVSQPESSTEIVDAAIAAFGHVDILINNAGLSSAVPATRETPEQFRSIVEVNLFGSYWMAQACGRVMTAGSVIVNIASVLGITSGGLPQAAYSSSKAGVIALTRDLAAQWTGRKGIRVVGLAPGFFESEMTATYPDNYIEDGMRRVLSGRMGTGEELAAAAVFLTSNAGGYVTGTTLCVDGGITAN